MEVIRDKIYSPYVQTVYLKLMRLLAVYSNESMWISSKEFSYNRMTVIKRGVCGKKDAALEEVHLMWLILMVEVLWYSLHRGRSVGFVPHYLHFIGL